MRTSISYNKDFDRLSQLIGKFKYHIQVLGYLKKRLGKKKIENFQIESCQARDVLLLQDLERLAEEMVNDGVADKSLQRPVAKVWLAKDTISKLPNPDQLGPLLELAEHSKLSQYRSLAKFMRGNGRFRKLVLGHIAELNPAKPTNVAFI